MRGEAQPSRAHSTISNGWWWTYAEMIAALHNVLMDFQVWCESCPCHFDVKNLARAELREFSRLQHEPGLSSETDGPCYGCPLKGLRAPELAAGVWRQIFADLSDGQVASLLGSLSGDGFDDVLDVVSEFDEGK